jgi:hypothetical protein
MQPEHMDRWSRNARLYETLKGMGLFVSPIPEADDATKINRLVVSADLPWLQGCAEDSAERSVDRAAERSQVAEVVTPTETGRVNVIDFPAVR